MQGTDKPWRRIDAKKGNHRPRRMGHDGSLGNCTSRARAASPEAPTAQLKWTISGNFWLPVASLGPSTCISPRQSAGCFPILIERPFIVNTVSRTDKRKRPPAHMIKLTETRATTPYVSVHPDEDINARHSPLRKLTSAPPRLPGTILNGGSR